ncbi:nitrite reductase/ring-hydroxylating ferredoxin subunit [Nonomuraea polychroma]|jgi:Rieske Fe-S protein|uniref:Cytochrome bc1 complex Rieske iron-sulfur subunit n=1 Tax=Nonomuraea polychroma TaxID=46176 RepID=A0A438M980_9ACTN|nr:Rieske (2Fe-2S) protein [Nonomuraea polychroma]RVX42270.1 nitrite reductase/ring-hydroxylating ferredoxin subunit [Nonomuraea polychroma]
MTETTRRTMMLGAGGAGLAAVLTGCASYGSPTTEATAEPPAEEPAEEASSAAPKKKSASKGKALAATSDIPEGGGKVFKGQKIVVTQPTAGEFKAFTAVCTHAGCTVDDVSDNTINCPCHGSKFSIEDGSVADGPAGGPLAEKKITVDGDQIRLA